MPTYRVYYAEREPTDSDKSPFYGARLAHLGRHETEPYKETEWEEQVEAPDVSRALDAFFREHIRDNSELMWVDGEGQSRPVEGLSYDADKRYIWIEESDEGGRRLMEYQGIDEATPGLVTCPLCDGRGEVEEELADEYLAEWEEED